MTKNMDPIKIDKTECGKKGELPMFKKASEIGIISQIKNHHNL